MFFDMRLRLFNKFYRYDILKTVTELPNKVNDNGIRDGCKKTEADFFDAKIVILPVIFSDGLTEAPFGTFESFVWENQLKGSSGQTMLSLGHSGAMYDARYTLLMEQIKSISNIKNEIYAVGKPFRDIFVFS